MAPDDAETERALPPRPGGLRLALAMAIAPALGAALFLGALELGIRARVDPAQHGRYTLSQGLAFVKKPPAGFELPRDWAQVAAALPVVDSGIPPERHGAGLRIVAIGSSVASFRGPNMEREPNLNGVCERALREAGIEGAEIVNHTGVGRFTLPVIANTLLFSRYYSPDAILIEVLAGGNLFSEPTGFEPADATDQGIVAAAASIARYVEDARQTARAYAELAPAAGFDAGLRIDSQTSFPSLEIARARLDANLTRRGLERMTPVRDRSVEAGTFAFTAYLELAASRLTFCRRDPYPADIRAKNLAAFQSMAAFSRESGAPIAVVIIPDEVQVSPRLFDEVTRYLGEDRAHFDLDGPQRIYTELAAEAGIRSFDLTPRLRADPDPETLYVVRNSHLNERGNRVVGEEMARALLESDFLDRWKTR